MSLKSFYARMFLDLQARIKEFAPEWNHVDQNFGQYAFTDFRPEAYDKALLIDFPKTPYSAIGNLDMHGVATISVLQLFSPFSQSHNLAPEEVRVKALEYYEMEHRLIECLHGWSPDYCTPLILSDELSHNRNETRMRIREIMFTTSFERSGPDEEQPITLTFNGFIG